MIERIPRYLALGDEVCAVAERLAAEANAWVRETKYERTFRDDVLTALCLKIDSAFRALLDDVRTGRAEAMHHLKTMAESFIYYYVVAADPSSVNADRLYAKVLHEKAVFVRENGQPGAEERAKSLERARDEWLNGAERWPRVRRLAKEHGPGLGSWYTAVYRLACEPAHIGDLHEFMPGADDLIRVGPAITADHRASVAVDRGLELMINLIDAVTQVTELRADVEALRGKLAAIRDPRT